MDKEYIFLINFIQYKVEGMADRYGMILKMILKMTRYDTKKWYMILEIIQDETKKVRLKMIRYDIKNDTVWY